MHYPRTLHLMDLGWQVMPYWGLSYNPIPFQPVCKGGVGSAECQNSTSTCRGFENEAAVPGTNNYTCKPHGSSYFDDCWKCPPKVSAAIVESMITITIKNTFTFTFTFTTAEEGGGMWSSQKPVRIGIVKGFGVRWHWHCIPLTPADVTPSCCCGGGGVHLADKAQHSNLGMVSVVGIVG